MLYCGQYLKITLKGRSSIVKSHKKAPDFPQDLINTVSVSNLLNHFFGNLLRIFPHLQTK
jgi:hypothetical protein